MFASRAPSWRVVALLRVDTELGCSSRDVDLHNPLPASRRDPISNSLHEVAPAATLGSFGEGKSKNGVLNVKVARGCYSS